MYLIFTSESHRIDLQLAFFMCFSVYICHCAIDLQYCPYCYCNCNYYRCFCMLLLLLPMFMRLCGIHKNMHIVHTCLHFCLFLCMVSSSMPICVSQRRCMRNLCNAECRSNAADYSLLSRLLYICDSTFCCCALWLVGWLVG